MDMEIHAPYDQHIEVHKYYAGTVLAVVVLALAVVGTGAAFAYRSYVGAPRTGEI